MRVLHRAFLCAGLGVFSTYPANAIDVPFSQGVLSFNDARHVTVGPGGDFSGCDAAFASFPKDGAGGIIEFLPGVHTTVCGNLGGRGSILVTGRLGPNGERPVITTPDTVRPDGTINHEPFIVFNSNAPDNFAIQNLDIVDTGATLNVWNYGGMVMRNVRIDNSNGSDAVKVYPTNDWDVAGYAWQSWLEIYDSEVSRGGSANSRHNLYIGRIDRVLVDGLYTHSAQHSHAFKSIARNNEIINSTFRTTDLAFGPAHSDRYLSTTLIDLASCASSVIRNNTFVGMLLQPYDRPPQAESGPLGSTTSSFIDLQRRKTKVGGCDTPRYEDADEYDWEGAAAEGYTQENEALFHHVIEDNVFVNEGIREIQLVRNIGTTYVEDNGLSFIRGDDLPLPDQWFERSVVWAKGNETSGNIALGDQWVSSIPLDVDLKAPIFDLDRFDIVKVTPGTASPGLSLSNVALTLHQYEANSSNPSGNAGVHTVVSVVSEPPMRMVTGLFAVIVVLLARRRQRVPAVPRKCNARLSALRRDGDVGSFNGVRVVHSQGRAVNASGLRDKYAS